MRVTHTEILELLPRLSLKERRELDQLLGISIPVWEPLPGPQTAAYESTADIIGYGGAAGGGKTDLACGKALTRHQMVLILRREATQLTGIIDRFTQLLGTRDGYNGADRIWRIPGRQIEFGSTPNLDDWNKYQGRPHDLLVLEEAANFLELQVRALLAWVRSVDPRQKCQALLTFNPPTSSEGQWIIEFFAPWLDRKHPNPAEPGELRWFATINGKDVEVESGQPFDHNGERIKPMSRTFIRSRVIDNPFLMETGYMSTLQSLPEPLRSQMLHGDFEAGMGDDVWQVIPSAWVDAAMARWKPLDVKPPMDQIGVDVARGGKDQTVISRRHDNWYDVALVYPGAETPDGPTAAGLVLVAARDSAPVNVDVIGVGASVYDFLKSSLRQQVLGVNVAEASTVCDRTGRLRFKNLRSQLWWQFREHLDPVNNKGVALPPDKRLRAELCAPRWRLSGYVVQVESRDEIIERIGRSPDLASAYILAAMQEPKRSLIEQWASPAKKYDDYLADALNADPYTARAEYDPFKNM